MPKCKCLTCEKEEWIHFYRGVKLSEVVCIHCGGRGFKKMKVEHCRGVKRG